MVGIMSNFGCQSVRLFLALMVSLTLTACQTTLNSPPQASNALPLAAIVAFEGFVGVPKEAGEEVISALVSAGAERRIALVAAGDPTANYIMRGYLAPQAEGGTTAVSYAWDLFDRAGNRVQRLVGETRLPAAVADGWTLVQGSGARAIAEQSASEISRFVSGVIAPSTAPLAQIIEAGATLPSQKPAVPAVVVTEPSPPGSVAPPRQARARSVVVGEVAGLDASIAGQLRLATEKALGEVGYVLAAPGAPSDVRLSAEATVNPVQSPPTKRLAAVVWKVADGRGQELGEIRQLARLGARNDDALSGLTKAIDGLLSGVVALAPPRP